jgi:hypothetical protein
MYYLFEWLAPWRKIYLQQRLREPKSQAVSTSRVLRSLADALLEGGAGLDTVVMQCAQTATTPVNKDGRTAVTGKDNGCSGAIARVASLEPTGRLNVSGVCTKYEHIFACAGPAHFSESHWQRSSRRTESDRHELPSKSSLSRSTFPWASHQASTR